MDTGNPIKLLSDLVSIDTQSFKSDLSLINYLSNLFKNFETYTQDYTDREGVEGKNLIVKIPGSESSKSIIFICHIDTVPVGENWSTNPFKLVEKNEILYGRGVCDTKGGIASLITAVLSLKEQPKYDTYLVFDGDEEVYSAGAIKFLENFSIKNPYFIFLEPTMGNVMIGQRSLLKLTVKTSGTLIHASQATPEINEKNNAISKMANILDLLKKDAEEIFKTKDEILGSTTQNFGIISGGTAINITAQSCILKLERRMLTTLDLDKEFERLSNLIKSIDPSAEVILDGSAPGFSTDKNSTLVKECLSYSQKKYINAKIMAFDAWSEAGLFHSLGPVIIIGPGDLQNQAHRVNESVSKKKILDFVEIFKNIILNIKL